MSTTRSVTNTMTASYRIVTPMFCSGADPAKAELRLHSIKGAIRYWWRSLAWGQVKDAKSIQDLEASIFGAANDHGQSKIRLRLVTEKTSLDKQVSRGERLGEGELKGANYFGYGVSKSGQLTRPMIPGGKFTLEVRFSPSLDDQTIATIRRALILLGTVGGLGSKSRKGYGSLTLTSIDGAAPDQMDPVSLIQTAVKAFPDSKPDWNAWSRASRIITVTSQTKDALQLLDSIGQEQIYFRSWGHKGNVLGAEREANFKRDHDMSKKPSSHKSPPDRIAFGLPHSYGKGDSNDVKPQGHDRRGSSLFIHVHQSDPDSQATGVLAFLPSRLLPDGEKIKAFGNLMDYSKSEDFWYPVHAFLDRLVGNGDKPADRPGYEKLGSNPDWWQKRTELIGTEVNLG